MSAATSGIKQTFSVVEDLLRPWDLTGHIATTATPQELTGPRPSKHVKTNILNKILATVQVEPERNTVYKQAPMGIQRTLTLDRLNCNLVTDRHENKFEVKCRSMSAERLRRNSCREAKKSLYEDGEEGLRS